MCAGGGGPAIEVAAVVAGEGIGRNRLGAEAAAVVGEDDRFDGAADLGDEVEARTGRGEVDRGAVGEGVGDRLVGRGVVEDQVGDRAYGLSEGWRRQQGNDQQGCGKRMLHESLQSGKTQHPHLWAEKHDI